MVQNWRGGYPDLAMPNGQQQHLTIPAHKPLRVGTLRQILKDVANQVGTNLDALIQALDA